MIPPVIANHICFYFFQKHAPHRYNQSEQASTGGAEPITCPLVAAQSPRGIMRDIYRRCATWAQERLAQRTAICAQARQSLGAELTFIAAFL
jgi:hypothetical protein